MDNALVVLHEGILALGWKKGCLGELAA